MVFSVRNRACAISRLVIASAAMRATRSSEAVRLLRLSVGSRRGRAPAVTSSSWARTAMESAPQARASSSALPSGLRASARRPARRIAPPSSSSAIAYSSRLDECSSCVTDRWSSSMPESPCSTTPSVRSEMPSGPGAPNARQRSSSACASALASSFRSSDASRVAASARQVPNAGVRISHSSSRRPQSNRSLSASSGCC
jgi:hypothetical protein